MPLGLMPMVHAMHDGKSLCGDAGIGVEITWAFDEHMLAVTCEGCCALMLAELDARSE